MQYSGLNRHIFTIKLHVTRGISVQYTEVIFYFQSCTRDSTPRRAEIYSVLQYADESVYHVLFQVLAGLTLCHNEVKWNNGHGLPTLLQVW